MHSKPVLNISTAMEINSEKADSPVFNMITNSHNDLSRNEFDSFCVLHEIPVLEHLRTALLVNWQGAGHMTAKTHGSVVERRFLMTGRCVIYFLPGKPSHFYIANLTASLASFLEFMTVACASNARTCIMHARDDDLHTLKQEGNVRMRENKSILDPTLDPARYKPLKCLDRQVNCQKTVKE